MWTISSLGGFAVILHGLPRFTVDMDFFVKMAENNIQSLEGRFTWPLEILKLRNLHSMSCKVPCHSLWDAERISYRYYGATG